MRRYVLDSYAMIAYLEDEPGADRVAQVLRQLIQGKVKGFMSVVNWGEVYYNTMTEQGVDEAERVILQLDKCPIQIVGNKRDGSVFLTRERRFDRVRSCQEWQG
jgi:ribonuclease VapC